MNTRVIVIAVGIGIILASVGYLVVNRRDGQSVATGPAGFHAACFGVDGRPYINAVGTAWSGDVDGTIKFTMDSGLKAVIHGDRCLVEEMSAEQWAAVHRPAPVSPAPVSSPVPASPAPSPVPSALIQAAKSYTGEFAEHAPKK